MRFSISLLLSYAIHSAGFQRCHRHQIYSASSSSCPQLETHGMDSSFPIMCNANDDNQQMTSEKSDSDIVMKQVETILLPKLFGHPQFRPGQREVISKVLAGESCLAILPTGAGKSLLYMLPSQLLDGITLVVSPLLALMRDQVEALRREGISAVRLDSSMSPDDLKTATQEIISGRVKVLYITPERFNNEKFRRLLGSLKVAMFVVDEAHCISEWGHAFRPDYLRLSHFATASNAQVRLALTATATKRVANDILERLGIKSTNIVQLPSIRKNLILSVKSFSYPKDGYTEKLEILLKNLPYLAQGGSAIIYVNKQIIAERLASDLAKKGYNSRAYHSGLSNREEIEKWFLRENENENGRNINENESGQSSKNGKNSISTEKLNTENNNVGNGNGNELAPIVVGTTAFGMGIDKSNVRSVVHFDLSRSVEDYVQGIGRAGRDGKQASCLAFLADTDIPSLRSQCIGVTPSRNQLKEMVKRVFGTNAFPAKYDSALYVNFYEISHEFDINDLQLLLSLAHLVQNEIITDLTPVYCTYKVGQINEDFARTYVTILNSNLDNEFDTNSETENNNENENFSSDDQKKLNEKNLKTTILIMDHIRKNAKRKWCTIDTILTANEIGCTPSEVVYCVGQLIANNVCTDGGISRIMSRYKVLRTSLFNDNINKEEELNNIVDILHNHAVEVERRGVVRVNELVELLNEGSDEGSERGSGRGSDGDRDMWDSISKYFQESEITQNYNENENENYNDHEIQNISIDKRTKLRLKKNNYHDDNDDRSHSNTNKNSIKKNRNELKFDETAWNKILELLEEEILPVDDIFLITRFATGVNSPRLRKLKLSRHNYFGCMVHCDWHDIIIKVDEYINM